MLLQKFIQQKRVGTAPVLGRDGQGRPDGGESLEGLDAADASGMQAPYGNQEVMYQDADDKEVLEEQDALDNQEATEVDHEQ